MPVIPAPHEHLQAALAAIDEHLDHHTHRIEAHEAEISALRTLRERYESAMAALGLGHLLEQPSVFVEDQPATAIPVVEPTFDEVVSTMSGRIPQP